MIVVPTDAPGFSLVRNLPVIGRNPFGSGTVANAASLASQNGIRRYMRSRPDHSWVRSSNSRNVAVSGPPTS